MKRWLFVCAVLGALLTASPAVLQTKAVVQSGESRTAAASAEPEHSQEMIKTYCAGCHNSQLPTPAGGLAHDTLNVQAAAEHPEIWEKAIRKLRGPLMPHVRSIKEDRMVQQRALTKHGNYPIPTVIVGGGNGKMKLGGQHIVMPERSPLANAHLTLLIKFGIEQDKFADSTGMISAL